MGTALEDIYYASKEDIEFFQKCTEGLPDVKGFSGTGFDANGEKIPYGLQAHSVRCLREIVQIVKPKVILEIGFNLGYSASMWLTLSGARLVSNDISDKMETIEAIQKLKYKFVQKFSFIGGDSATLFERFGDVLKGENFDLIFIDGGHLEHHVMADIKLALDLGIKWVAFDDMLPQFGPGVGPAIAFYQSKLELVKLMGNIALYQNTSV